MTIAYILNHIMEAVGVYCFLFFQYPHKRKIWKDWAILLLCYTILYGIYEFQSLNLNIISMLLLYVPLFRFLTGNSWRNSLNDSLIIFSIIDFSELLVEISTYLFKEQTEFEYSNISDFLLASLKVKIVYAILLASIIPILKKVRKKTPVFHDSNYITVSLCVLTLSLIAMQNLGFSTILQSNHIPWIYIILISFIVFSVVEIILTIHLQKVYEQLIDAQSTLQRREVDKNYTALVTQLDQEQKVLIHDFKNHLQTISSLISTKSFDEVQALIKELTRSSAVSTGIVLTKNRALSVLLARYKDLCSEQGVYMNIDVKNADLTYLTPTDITSLFANLIDNSIEACANATQPYLSLQIQTDHSRAMDIITIINTCTVNPLTKDHELTTTTKEDKLRHGFGMKSIQRVVDRYHGTMDLQYIEEDLLFQVTICLYQTEETQK